MKSLNRASLDVWTEYLRNSDKRKVSDRILLLDSYDKLTPAQEEELEILMKLETRFLAETEVKVDEIKKYLKKFNHYKDILATDERLLTIFYERVTDKVAETDVVTEEDVKEIYIKMMEEDMDVKGHDILNQTFKEIKEKAIQENTPCDDPDCIYCRPLSEDEYADAYDDLKEQGFLEKGIKEEDKLIQLMVTIHRLQEEVTILRSEEDDLFDGEDDDLEDDDEDF